jgi:acetylornithine deacetylase/succinyl-diaminopimelate desuccinylase-like protein
MTPAQATPTTLDPALATEMVEHLRALIRFDTTNPPGNEAPAASYVRDALAREGIEARVVEAEPGRASVVAWLRAKGPRRPYAVGDDGGPLLFVSHLDVVPAERAKWRRDPFAGDVHEGCVWGRGAVDCKHMTALSLATLVHLKRTGKELARDVGLVAFADEEAGSEKGARWLVAKEPDLIRAEWALNEVGGFTLHMNGRRFYPIQFAERGFAWLKLVAEGKPGHGSLPHDESAVLKLSRAVARLRARAFPVHATDPARTFLRALGRELGGTYGRLFRLLENPLFTDLVLRMIPEPRARALSALLRNTVSPTVLRAGEKENVIPGSAEATLDGRVLPGFTTDDLVAELKKVLGQEGEGIDVRVMRQAPPNVVPRETPFFDLIAKVVAERDPGAVAVPYMISGFTDAQPLAALGIKTYGFSPLRLPEDLPFGDLFHGHDERVPVEGIQWGLGTLVDVVERFCCK